MADDALDLHSLDDVIGAMYASISGPPGGQNWPLSQQLFHPRAQLVRTGVGSDGRPVAAVFSLQEYRANASELLQNVAFYEVETGRHIIRFGNILQAFSAYEARPAPDSSEILKRGLNMIHLYDDGQRWWIMQMIWDDEREGVRLPTELFQAAISL